VAEHRPEGEHRGEGSASLDERGSQLGTGMTGEEVGVGSQTALPTTVTGRQGEEHRVGFRGRQPHSANGEDVFDAEASPGPGQAGGDGAWRASRLVSELAEVGAGHVMAYEGVPVTLREVLERSSYRLVLLSGDHGGIWHLRRAEVGEAGLQPATAVGTAMLSGDKALADDDAVGDHRLRRETFSSGDDPLEGVLDEVVDRGFRDPSSDHPPQDRLDLGQPVAVFGEGIHEAGQTFDVMPGRVTRLREVRRHPTARTQIHGTFGHEGSTAERGQTPG